MFDDHMSWIQNPQKNIYLFLGHPVYIAKVYHYIHTWKYIGFLFGQELNMKNSKSNNKLTMKIFD